jgi:hypothetical protein
MRLTNKIVTEQKNIDDGAIDCDRYDHHRTIAHYKTLVTAKR